MTATKAIISLQGKHVEVDEAAILAINTAIANAPVGGSYSDDPIKCNQRMQLVARLTVDAVITKVEDSKA